VAAKINSNFHLFSLFIYCLYLFIFICFVLLILYLLLLLLFNLCFYFILFLIYFLLFLLVCFVDFAGAMPATLRHQPTTGLGYSSTSRHHHPLLPFPAATHHRSFLRAASFTHHPKATQSAPYLQSKTQPHLISLPKSPFTPFTSPKPSNRNKPKQRRAITHTNSTTVLNLQQNQSKPPSLLPNPFLCLFIPKSPITNYGLTSLTASPCTSFTCNQTPIPVHNSITHPFPHHHFNHGP
jgi:hypothetical protein